MIEDEDENEDEDRLVMTIASGSFMLRLHRHFGFRFGLTGEDEAASLVIGVERIFHRHRDFTGGHLHLAQPAGAHAAGVLESARVSPLPPERAPEPLHCS